MCSPTAMLLTPTHFFPLNHMSTDISPSHGVRSTAQVGRHSYRSRGKEDRLLELWAPVESNQEICVLVHKYYSCCGLSHHEIIHWPVMSIFTIAIFSVLKPDEIGQGRDLTSSDPHARWLMTFHKSLANKHTLNNPRLWQLEWPNLVNGLKVMQYDLNRVTDPDSPSKCFY